MKKTTSFRKLRIESLEERALMAVVSGTESHVAAAAAPMATGRVDPLHVTTCIDKIDANDGVISLREAIEKASAGDVITFDSCVAGKTITLKQTLNINKGVTINAKAIGGITIDCNSVYQNGIKISKGTERDPVKLAYITFKGFGSGTVNSGVTELTHCNFQGARFVGISNNSGILTATNCTVSGSGSDGISSGGELNLTNCVIEKNNNSGVYNNNSGVAVIKGGKIANNHSSYRGGGVNNSGTMSISNCVIQGNSAASNGGGIFSNKNLNLEGCTIFDNDANTGAGVYIYCTNAVIANCEISRNDAATDGGGIYNVNNMTLVNCSIWGNTAKQYGGGLLSTASQPITLKNCTIAGNSAYAGGGYYQCYTKNTTHYIYNSIIARNTASYAGNDIVDARPQSWRNIVAYNTLSSYDGWADSTACPTYVPSAKLFANEKNGNYTLAAGSAAINKGNNSYISGYSKDLAGKTRIVGGTVDIGAYEYQGTQKPDLTPSISGSVTAVSNGKFTLKGAKVKNNGQATASGYTVTVYASTDSTINSSDTKLATYTFSSTLAAGAAAAIPNKEISVSGLAEGKTYYIGWIVSTSNDSNTSNNTAKSGTITVPVTKKPDLTPSISGSVTAVSNGKFTLKGAKVKNNGKAAASGYTVTVYASTDSTINSSDTKLATYTFSSTLAAGAAAAIPNKEISVSSLAGGKTYYIGWIVSTGNDSNTSNNTAKSGTITVPAASPDLKANNGGSVTASSKGKFNLKLGAIENLGGKQAASGWKVTIYACTDTKFASSNTINLGTYTLSNGINPGKTRELTVKDVNSSKLKSGTSYYFKWVISNVKNETNTGNNTARTTKKFKVTNGVVASNALLPATANSKNAADSIFADYTDDMAVDFGLF